MTLEQMQGTLSRCKTRLHEAAKKAAADDPPALLLLNTDHERLQALRTRLACMTQKEFAAFMAAAPREKVKQNLLF